MVETEERVVARAVVLENSGGFVIAGADNRVIRLSGRGVITSAVTPSASPSKRKALSGCAFAGSGDFTEYAGTLPGFVLVWLRVGTQDGVTVGSTRSSPDTSLDVDISAALGSDRVDDRMGTCEDWNFAFGASTGNVSLGIVLCERRQAKARQGEQKNYKRLLNS